MRHESAGAREAIRDKELRAKSPRRRHRWRWIIGGMLTLVLLAIGVTGAVIELAPGAAPLTLPNVAAAPSGPLDGSWVVTTGSEAGFRVRETVIGFSNDVTGRTGNVSGTAVVETTQVVRATFRVSLGAIAVNGKTHQAQLMQSLGVTAHPVATVTLTRPVALPAAFSAGAMITRTAVAALTLNGVTRTVTVTLSARRDGKAIEAAGWLPVTFAEFGVTGPAGYGIFGSLASAGTAEFLLVLHSR